MLISLRRSEKSINDIEKGRVDMSPKKTLFLVGLILLSLLLTYQNCGSGRRIKSISQGSKVQSTSSQKFPFAGPGAIGQNSTPAFQAFNDNPPKDIERKLQLNLDTRELINLRIQALSDQLILVFPKLEVVLSGKDAPSIQGLEEFQPSFDSDLSKEQKSKLESFLQKELDQLFHVIFIIKDPAYKPESEDLYIKALKKLSDKSRKDLEEAYELFLEELKTTNVSSESEKRILMAKYKEQFFKTPSHIEKWGILVIKMIISLSQIRDSLGDDMKEKANLVISGTTLVLGALISSLGGYTTYVNAAPLTKDVQKHLLNTSQSIACMAAYSTENVNSIHIDHYPSGLSPWTLDDSTQWMASLRTPPFCYILKGIVSDLGDPNVKLKQVSHKNRFSPDECKDLYKDYFSKSSNEQSPYYQLESFVLAQSSKVSPLSLFTKSMGIMENDVVRAVSLINLTTFIRSIGESRMSGRGSYKRSKDTFLNQLSPLVKDVDDYHGQFYHWWGHLGLNYLYFNTKMEYHFLKHASKAYEVWQQDWEDIEVDDSGAYGGYLLGCLIDYYSNQPSKVSDTRWNQLKCDSLMTHEGYLGSNRSYTSFVKELEQSDYLSKNPYCDKLKPFFKDLLPDEEIKPKTPEKIQDPQKIIEGDIDGIYFLDSDSSMSYKFQREGDKVTAVYHDVAESLREVGFMPGETFVTADINEGKIEGEVEVFVSWLAGKCANFRSKSTIQLEIKEGGDWLIGTFDETTQREFSCSITPKYTKAEVSLRKISSNGTLEGEWCRIIYEGQEDKHCILFESDNNGTIQGTITQNSPTLEEEGYSFKEGEVTFRNIKQEKPYLYLGEIEYRNLEGESEWKEFQAVLIGGNQFYGNYDDTWEKREK